VRRTTLAVVLATGALSVPAVALAAGGEDSPTTRDRPATTPVQQEQQQPDQQRAPDRGPCPEEDGSGGSGGDSGGETTL
jgi:hypothetical protein